MVVFEALYKSVPVFAFLEFWLVGEGVGVVA